MNDTQIKTRLGLILQGVLGAALTKAGYAFDMDYVYDETCEIPDFLIPNGRKPKFMVETHQTEARDSFRMKILRAFTAVTESKAQYGNNLVSINVLFGDPEKELPASNVRAMCAIFDCNILPRKDSGRDKSIIAIERAALRGAEDESVNTEEAIESVVKAQPAGVVALAKLLKKAIGSASADKSLFPLWNLERARAKALGDPPESGDATYYKRMMLRSLFLSDDDFDELYATKDPDLCSDSVKAQLVRTGLAEVTEEIDGDHFSLESEVAHFLQDADAGRLRLLCRDILRSVPEMHWFFEDIRDSQRREAMSEKVLKLLGGPKSAFLKAFDTCFQEGEYDGICHTRCWIADIVPLALGRSHNYFNGLMYRDANYTLTLANPYPNIAIRSPRLGNNLRALRIYSEVCARILWDHVKQGDVAVRSLNPHQLAERLLKFRMDGAIKLKKLDPLFLVLTGICSPFGLTWEKKSVRSIIADLADERQAGVFSIAELQGGDKACSILLNAVSVHDGHGDDKSKEWGARRLATLYRIIDGKIVPSEFQQALFVIDGEWTDKDVARLYRSGWNRVVRLGALEQALREIFSIPKKIKSAQVRRIAIPDTALPLAAEDEDEE